MADYYPLIARAVAGLEKNTGDARRALYERARTALVAQLRSVTPALSENDVTRERLALEESIRKVEAEAARKTWIDAGHPASTRVKAPEFPRWESPAPAAADAEEELPPRQAPPRTDGAMLRPTATRANRIAAASAAMHAAGTGAQPNGMLGGQRYTDPVFDQPLADNAPAPQLRNAAARARPAGNERRSLLDAGLKDFREVVHETDELGEAPAHGAHALHAGSAGAYPPAHEYDRIDPYAGDPHAQDYPAPPPLLEQGPDYQEPRPLAANARQGAALERERAGRRSFRDAIRTAAVIVILAGVGSVTAWQWQNITAFYRSMSTPAPAPEVARVEPAQKKERKITDRIEPGVPPASQIQPALAAVPVTAPAGAAVAQKVVLYEEDPNDPQGKRYVGSAIWRTERVSSGPGQPAELAIRADVEIPDRKLAMTWSLRRNVDASLPATHTVEIMFRLPQDFGPGGVANVPGILMKQAEQTRGVPLAGLAVKVTNGFFLIGLSAAEADKERNVQMLKERQWFDIPVVYANNRRAILAVEKGTPGERVFAEAFAAWRQ
jgi:hypothetical protein